MTLKIFMTFGAQIKLGRVQSPEDVISVYVFGLSISSSVRFQEPTPLKLIGLKLCENKKEVRKPELNGYVPGIRGLQS